MPRRKNYQKMINKDDNGGRLERFVFNVLGVERGTDDTNGDNPDYLVLLKSYNSRKVEEKLTNDPNYITFTKNLVEYYKSTTPDHEFPINNEKAVLAVVRMIDIENSTNVWRFNRDGLNNMVKYIAESDTFINDLFATEISDRCSLVESLISAANPVGADSSGKAEPRSLASKICKYLSQYLSPDDNDDYYFINDSFVRKTLPFYCAYYGVDIGDRKEYETKYEQLFGILDDIRRKAAHKHDNDQKLTRGKMDHIMWYCYKNSGNDNEFTRIRKPVVPNLANVDNWFKAFVNLFGAIRIGDAFNILVSQYPDYEEQKFVDHINVLKNDSGYYKIENDIIGLSNLSADDISHLFDIQRDSDFDNYELPKKLKSKYYNTSYRNNESSRLVKRIIKDYSNCGDLYADELAPHIREALFSSFEEDLPNYLVRLFGGRINESNAKTKLRQCGIRIPIFKGHILN